MAAHGGCSHVQSACTYTRASAADDVFSVAAAMRPYSSSSPHRRTMMHGPTAPVTILTCTLAFASNLAGHEPHVVCEAVIAAHRQEVVHTESFIFANVITIPQDKLI